MIGFVLKTVVCSGLFICFYLLVLQREKMFRFNRYYLLAALVLSFSIPFMQFGIKEFSIQKSAIHTVVPAIRTIHGLQPETGEILPSVNTKTTGQVFTTAFFLKLSAITACMITLVLFLRFVTNLLKLYYYIAKNKQVKKNGFTIVKVNKKISPFSFFHYIFVSESDLQNEKIQPEIFCHERAHVRQKHTFDVILIEFITIFFWFNPFIYLFRKSIKINHEFLADEEVLKKQFDVISYQYLLLNNIVVKSQTVLSHSLNYLVTKKRLLIMTRETSKLKSVTLRLMCIPFVVATAVIFSNKIQAQSDAVKEQVLKTQPSDVIRADSVRVITKPGTSAKAIVIRNHSVSDTLQDDKIAILVEKQMNTPEVQEALKKAEEVSKMVSTPEFQEKIRKTVDVQKLIETPEYQATLKKIEEIHKYFDSPEWQEKMKKISELEIVVNSKDWQDKIEKAANLKE
jgi:beta-lactamase regulating signal transducer with metallopeptidase domain